VPSSRNASGTAWQPDASPMHARHFTAADWTVMLHGNVFLQYIDDEANGRGDRELGSVNWLMLMAEHDLLGGRIETRTMLSFEPATIGGCGYPDLLATGEVCRGRPIVDEQHPHDFFMELALHYTRPIGASVAVEGYGALSGEPALGPPGFPHRPSALPNPIAPITHHWLDSTHISFGVLTLGAFGQRWKVEGSAFNGREPDAQRWDFDFGPLDSYSARLWFLPSESWAFQLSAGHLEEAEGVAGQRGRRLDVNRATASATYHWTGSEDWFWATTAAWGLNDETGEPISNAGLLESSLYFASNIIFARGEVAAKSPHDFGIEGEDGGLLTVGKVAAGYVRELVEVLDVELGLGAGVSISLPGKELDASYGGGAVLGWSVFASVRPTLMRMSTSHHRM
jgi:hypothetical protein